MILKVKNLKKSFGRDIIFEGINMEIEPGDIIALIGRNGVGKTTLMQTIVNILNRDKGEVSLVASDNKYININKEVKYLEDLVYIPDRFDYFKNVTVLKVIKYYKNFYSKFDEKYCIDIIKETDLELEKSMSAYSKGELKIIGTILGISTNSKFLLIDEPYDGVDIINSKIMDRLIIDAASKGTGILISSHELERLEKIANKRLFFEHGKDLELYSEEIKGRIKKYQIVVKDEFTEELLNSDKFVFIMKVGRVATVLYDSENGDIEKIFKDNNIVQHDELLVKMEDIFIWNSKENKKVGN